MNNLDPWKVDILAWLDRPENSEVEFVTVDHLLSEVVTTDSGRTRRANQMRLGKIMAGLGWGHERRTPSPGQKRTWGYVAP